MGDMKCVVARRRLFVSLSIEYVFLFIFCSLRAADSRESVSVRTYFIIFIVSGCIYVVSIGNRARHVRAHDHASVSCSWLVDDVVWRQCGECVCVCGCKIMLYYCRNMMLISIRRRFASRSCPCVLIYFRQISSISSFFDCPRHYRSTNWVDYKEHLLSVRRDVIPCASFIFISISSFH